MLVSAIVGHGNPRRLVLELLKNHIVISSWEMLAELLNVTVKRKVPGNRERSDELVCLNCREQIFDRDH